MQIKITYKEDGKINPFPLTQIYETPYVDGESNEWMCGFNLNKKNECALRLWHVQSNGGRFDERKSWLVKSDYSWDDYFEWLAKKVLRIEVDGEIVWKDESIEIGEEEETTWTSAN